MARHNDTGQLRRSPLLRALVLAVACGWLLFVLGVMVSPAVFAFGAQQPSYHAANFLLSSPTDTSTSVPPTDTPTDTPAALPTDTPTDVPVASPTPTATTAPSGGGGGGGGNGGGGGGGQSSGGSGPAGPNITRVVFSQPTVGADDSGPLQGLTPSAFGSNGLLLASTLSCVAALLGIIIAAIALLVLVRGGYGPFLKALLRGKRAGRKRGKQAEAESGSGRNSGQLPPRSASGTNYRSGAGYAPRDQGNAAGFRDGPNDGYEGYPPPPARSASPQARPPSPGTRSRQNWR